MILDDGGDATLLMHLGFAPSGVESAVARPSDQRGRGGAVRRHQEAAREGQARLVQQDTPTTIRGVTEETTTGVHRLYQMQKKGTAAVPGDQRQRQRHQVEVRQPLRLPRVAGRRHPPRHRRDDGRQGRDGRGLRRRRQGLGGVAAPGRLPASWSRRSIRSARCRRRWRATRSPPWRTPRRAPTSSSPPPATSTSSPSSTCAR